MFDFVESFSSHEKNTKTDFKMDDLPLVFEQVHPSGLKGKHLLFRRSNPSCLLFVFALQNSLDR